MIAPFDSMRLNTIYQQLEDDARATLVRATPRGMTVLQEGRGRRIARLQAAMQALNKRDLETLRQATTVLEELVQAL